MMNDDGTATTATITTEDVLKIIDIIVASNNDNNRLQITL
jgi:hypothetical protein